MQVQSEYTFNFDWETVVKGFWNKYPCKEFDFIKMNHVVDLVINADNTLSIKRLVLAQKFMMWSLTLEEIKLDVVNRQMEMQTKLVKASKLIPDLCGMETIVYKAIDDNQTYYSKLLPKLQKSSFTKFLSKFNNSFKKGIEVVEARCRELQQK